MARWSANISNWTPASVADTTNFTNAQYQALQGGSATQRSNILEVYMGGLASVTSPMELIFGRDSTVGATSLTGAQVNALDPATAALAAPPVSFNSSTTKPQRSSTGYLLNLAFNAFGGVVRWVAAPGEEIGILGASASNGEVSISMKSGTAGAISSHIIFEPF